MVHKEIAPIERQKRLLNTHRSKQPTDHRQTVATLMERNADALCYLQATRCYKLQTTGGRTLWAPVFGQEAKVGDIEPELRSASHNSWHSALKIFRTQLELSTATGRVIVLMSKFHGSSLIRARSLSI